MKSLLFSILLTSLVSCGNSSKAPAPGAGQNQLNLLTENHYSIPKLNVLRTVTIDENVSTIFEDMSIRSNEKSQILGDEAFYVNINAQMNPFREEFELGFYNSTEIKNAFYADMSTSMAIAKIGKNELNKLKLKDIEHVQSANFVWGKRNLDYSSRDMLNKVYVFNVVTKDKHFSVEYAASASYIIWFECIGNEKQQDDLYYSCGKYDLKFNYKLIDYQLSIAK